MTYNQVVTRIKAIATAHRQIRNCYKGLVTDFLTDRSTLYPSAFIQDNTNNNISVTNREINYSFRMFILDLVHLAGDAKVNEQDVLSDCMLIAIDMVAQLGSFKYTDWRVSAENPTQFVVEDENDHVAGVMLDFTIRVLFNKDKCQIPFNGDPIYIDSGTPVPFDQPPRDVEDLVYKTIGDEGNQIVIPDIQNKKIILITREGAALYQVSNNPSSTEFVFDGVTITLGLEVNTEASERFLIIYRNY